jgi:hypothetical protein
MNTSNPPADCYPRTGAPRLRATPTVNMTSRQATSPNRRGLDDGGVVATISISAMIAATETAQAARASAPPSAHHPTSRHPKAATLQCSPTLHIRPSVLGATRRDKPAVVRPRESAKVGRMPGLPLRTRWSSWLLSRRGRTGSRVRDHWRTMRHARSVGSVCRAAAALSHHHLGRAGSSAVFTSDGRESLRRGR